MRANSGKLRLNGNLVRKALAFARRRHRGQRRKGDFRPFISHPIAVARILARHRMPEEVVAAGFLHDVLEDTPTSAEELRERFGSRVARLVQDVTEADKKEPWEVRKNSYLRHLRRASRGALAVSCADKLHNTLALVAAYRREGSVVLDRFSRGIDQKLDYHRKVISIVRKRWSSCPILPDLEKALKGMEEICRVQTASEPQEIEIKFSVKKPAVLETAAGLTALGRFRKTHSHRERQVNSYWDTADGRLRRARAVLKTRRVGKKTEITFKRELGHRGGVSERIEVTRPVPGSAKIQRVLEEEPFLLPVQRARKITGRRPLQEVLCMRTDRRVRRFAAGDSRVELSVDRVDVLRSGRVVGSFREVELEKLSGKEQRFLEAVRDLKRRLGPGARISRVPKVVVGLRQAARAMRPVLRQRVQTNTRLITPFNTIRAD